MQGSNTSASQIEAAGGFRPGQFSANDPRGSQTMNVGDAAAQFLREYSRERPEVVALWAFGIGFVLGWKLKLW
jgi:hypothetical protein